MLPGNLTGLDFLWLTGTQISGELPDYLCEVTELEFDCSDLLCGCDCACMNSASANATSFINVSGTTP